VCIYISLTIHSVKICYFNEIHLTVAICHDDAFCRWYLNVSVPFLWSSSPTTSQLFQCVIDSFIVYAAVWTVHFIAAPKSTHRHLTWPEKFWSMNGIIANIQSASEYVTFALSSTLFVTKQDSLYLSECVTRSLLGVAEEVRLQRKIFKSSNHLLEGLCVQNVVSAVISLCATWVHFGDIFCSLLFITSFTDSLCFCSHLPRQEHEPTAVRDVTAMQFMNGQLQVTCCNCHAIMCSCDIRHSSADCWLLSAGLQTDSSRRIGIGGPANSVIFYIENKFRAITLQDLKACRRSGGIVPSTFQLSVRWR